MLTKTLTTEELSGTTVASAEEKGGAEARAKVGRGTASGRRVMRCGEWIRLGDAAADAVDGAGHVASEREDAGA